jgi:hypothetical protein
MAIPSQSEPQTTTTDDASLLPLTHPTWRSADYISTLAHIEELQRQLHQVRLAPREVAFCLADTKESPEVTLQRYKESSEEAGKRIKELKENWMNEESARIFVKVKEIEQKLKSQSVGEPRLEIDAGAVPPYGWVEKKAAEEKGGLTEEGMVKQEEGDVEEHDTAGDGSGTEDEQMVVDSLKPEFSSLDWETPATKEVLLAKLRCKGGILSVRITHGTSQSRSAKSTYQVQVLGGGSPRELRELSECINARIPKGNLRHLMVSLICPQTLK